MAVIVPTNLQMHAAVLVDINGNPLSSGLPATIAGPLNRRADTASVSVALSTEDVALLTAALKVIGNVAVGAAASGSPVLVAGKDTAGNVEYLFTDTTGRQIIVGAAADGAAVTGNPVLMAGQDGTNAQTLLTFTDGSLRVIASKAAGIVDGVSSSGSGLYDEAGTGRPLAVYTYEFDGSTYNKKRANSANTVLASAARTATVSTDIINYNGRTIAVTLNITVAPNTASTITLQIRAKDSISGNYTTILASAAIVGTATTGVVPVTNRYRVGDNITVVANVSAADVLNKTLNVNMVHSNADSWTYSVSADIGM